MKAGSSLPFKSLDGASTTGPGAVRDFEDSVVVKHTVAMTATGSPSSYVLAVEGSHDGSAWFQLYSWSGAPDGVAVADVPADHVIRYIRANLKTFSGGSSPTTAVTIASALGGN